MTIDPRQEWATPKNFFDVVQAEFDFQLDAAAKVCNSKLPAFISPETDAFRVPWIGKLISFSEHKDNEFDITSASSNGEVSRVWVNPGFGNLGPWMKKAWEEAQNHPFGIVAVLGLISPSTDWWKKYVVPKATEIRLIGGERIQFDPADGIEASTNSRENCLIIFINDEVQNTYTKKEPYIHTWYWKESEVLTAYENPTKSKEIG